MNHKRKRPKNRRAGCLHCKPHKANGAKHTDPTPQMMRERETEREERAYAAAYSVREDRDFSKER